MLVTIQTELTNSGVTDFDIPHTVSNDGKIVSNQKVNNDLIVGQDASIKLILTNIGLTMLDLKY